MHFWLEKWLWTKIYFKAWYKTILNHSVLFDFLGLRMKKILITSSMSSPSCTVLSASLCATNCLQWRAFSPSSGALHKETKRVLQASRPACIFSLRTWYWLCSSWPMPVNSFTDHRALLSTEAGPSACQCHLFLHYIFLISGIGSSFIPWHGQTNITLCAEENQLLEY